MRDKEIEDSIKEYSEEIFKSKAGINTVMRFSPLIQLGQTELQGRQTKRVTCLSIIVSIVSLFIAGTALYVSFNTSRASTHWENTPY